MMKLPAAFAGFEDICDLGHGDGVDMRPTLLRVLTDLYLQRPTHTPEDERYYTELALRLIEATDVPERASLAARLAPFPSAPRAVIDRLARDTIDVARPILERSPCHTAADLAARAEACELSELFYTADAAERRLILVNLDYASLTPSPPPANIQRADVWRLESAALQHNTETVLRELERMLGVSRAQARRIVDDELGEPIVVAAKAINLAADVLQRMLLFMNPRVGQSVNRVYELAELYSEISVDAARRMVTIWRDADETESRPTQHETIAWRTVAENARRALSEVSRRPELQHDVLLRHRSG